MRTDRLSRLSQLCSSALLLALIGVGCSTESDPRAIRIARLIPTDPSEFFHRDSLLDVDVVKSWSFARATSPDPWRINHDESEYTIDTGGLRLHPERRYTTLELLEPIEPATIDAFEIRLRGLPRHSVVLQWRREDDRYDKRRRIEIPVGQEDDQGYRVFRHSVRNHPRWVGDIAAVRFEFAVPKNSEVTIDRVDALLEEISEDRLVETLARTWKVELGDDLRNSLLAPPGLLIERTIEVPPNARLSISYGMQEGAPTPTTFEIRARTGQQEETLLLQDQLAETQVWREALLDLSGFESQQIELRLSTSSNSTDTGLSFPVWANPEVVAPAPDSVNVIFISIDTLRADHLSAYGYARPTSPNIDGWAAKQGLIFENAFAAAPWTLPSHISMFTGLDAHRHGVNYPGSPTSHLRTLAEQLRDAGYVTLAVTGGGFVHPQYGLSRGFDLYQTQGAGMAADRELELGLASTLEILERHRDRPFFLFFHTYEVHNPFRAREPYFSQLTGGGSPTQVDVEFQTREARNGFLELRTLRATGSKSDEEADPESAPYSLALDLYDSQIAYTDQAIGTIFEALDRLDLTDRTIVLLTSDHGELFGEHGLANHVSLYEENLRVPLILAAPHRDWEARRVPEQVRSIDIMPTLLELLDLPIPTDLDGVSLLPLIESGRQSDRDAVAISYAAASNHGLAARQANHTKYHFRNAAWVSEGPIEIAFDIASDSTETEPRAPHGGDLDRLRDLLLRRFAMESSGLRVRLSNSDGAEPLAGSLWGPDLQVSRPKALDTTSGKLEREAGGRARFEIPPGQIAEILIEGASRPLQVQMQHRLAPGETVRFEIDPALIEAVRTVRRTEAGWEETELPEPVGDGVFFWWQGTRGQRVEEAYTIDPALQEQLEALGYIDN